MVVMGFLGDFYGTLEGGSSNGCNLNATSTIPLRQLCIVTNDVFAFFDEN